MFRELLEELLSDTGAEYCCVADAALGKVIEECGAEGPGERMSLAVLGWSATAAGYLAAAAADDLDDMIVTSRHAHHLVRQVGAGSARPLLVYARLDRRRGQLAVARRELAAIRLDRSRATPVRPAVVAGQTRLLERPAPPVAVPLPRRQPAALPVQRRAPEAVPVSATGLSPPGGRWRTDPATMRRVLHALQNLR